LSGCSVNDTQTRKESEQTINVKSTQDTKESEQLVVDENNKTLQAALEIEAKKPGYWESYADMDDSTTILVNPGLFGFIMGELKATKDGKTILLNSDTDPDATTLGAIRKIIEK